MDSKKLDAFFLKLDTINKNQNALMTNFVSQANNRAGTILKFEWEDKSLFDYVDFKFDEVKISWRNYDKEEDNTQRLVKPINDLIRQFNNRHIDYYEFIAKYKTKETNLIEANKSQKYSIYYDDFERLYADFKTATITGVGGMGKSHFLWECQNKIQKNDLYKSLFLYGKYFSDVEAIPWKEIQEYSNYKEFLLVIDGINEIVDSEKRKYIYNHIKGLSKCKHIRIIISYRSYSLPNIVDGRSEEEFIDDLLINKINFAGVDFDSSISEIVSNFKVDISYFYHILYSNNPMHIRMLIESDILNNQRLYDELKERSVVSITFIYERFIKSACKRLWKENEQTYWVAVKNLCKVLYDSNRVYFFKTDICSNNIDVEKFINDLKNGGYIDCYDNDKYYFSWEQLSNYLIARSFNADIQGKSDDEICFLFKKKSLEFPRITQFLLSVLVEKYHKNFDGFISFVSRVRPNFSKETLLNITIKNIQNRKDLQKFIPCNDIVQHFCVYGGIPNRAYNCESFLFEYLCSLKLKIIKPGIYFNRAEILRKLKFNLYNLNGEHFLIDNANEFCQFAILCLLIPDKEIVDLSEKTIYDLIELCKIDFSQLVFHALEKCNSPLLQRSIYNVICHLSVNKRHDYTNILDAIQNSRDFFNAKVLTNYCKLLNFAPFEYAYLEKINLFEKYAKSISKIKSTFDEFESLNGLISVIRTDKLFYSLEMERYNNLKLNFRLLNNPPKQVIVDFNKAVQQLVDQYNKCNCNVEIWDDMFKRLLNAMSIHINKTLLNQEDLFFCFIAHLNETLQYYGINDEDIEWYRSDRFRQHKVFPDNITMILTICVEEYMGSLMCNYFQEDCRVAYWGDKIHLGFLPISYNEEQINLCSPIQSYNATIEKLDIAVINRLNECDYIKDAKWADDMQLSLKTATNILKPYIVDDSAWILLGCYITNRTYYANLKHNREYSEECIILHCATNYDINKKRALDRAMTIEIKEYEGSVFDFAKDKSDFCKIIKPIKEYSDTFKETNLVFPPATIVAYLGLSFDSKRSAWIDSEDNVVIICNNNFYRRHHNDIGGTIYIKKDYFEKVESCLSLHYYCYTEKMSHEVAHYSNKSDTHLLIKNNRVIKACKNTGSRETFIRKLHNKCTQCLIYKLFQEHQKAINDYLHRFDN